MRIIAGKFRGRNLKSPPSLETRPTSDRLRETLFNIIAQRLEGIRFLDLCAGSGAVGIEALSRGARQAIFVDRERKICQLIQMNLDLCRVSENEAEVITCDAALFLKRSLKQQRDKVIEPWDIVYYDPPYADDYTGVLEFFAEHGELLSAAGLLIVEHDRRNSLPQEVGSLHSHRILNQGDSRLSFYRTASVET